MDSIRRRWMEKDIVQNIAIKHLELLKSVYRGEEERFLEEELEVTGKEVVEEEAPTPARLPPKIAKVAKEVKVEAPPVAKALSDDQLFRLIEQVNVLRKEAKIDIDNKDREAAYRKLEEAIGITKQLIAAGAVGQEKRLEKLEEVANSIKKLSERER